MCHSKPCILNEISVNTNLKRLGRLVERRVHVWDRKRVHCGAEDTEEGNGAQRNHCDTTKVLL